MMRPLVVIPTYNESACLKEVVLGVLDADPTVEVLIVDDSSPDGTGDLADKLAKDDRRVAALHRPGKAGLGAAYRAGFDWGLHRSYDAFCEMDADLSHDPTDLPRILDRLTAADVAIGSRYVPGGAVENWPKRRQLLSRTGNRYVAFCTGLPVKDATSGFRAYRRAVIEEIDIDTVRSDGYSFQVEMVLRAWRLGFAVREVPILFTERAHGASKMSGAIVREALWRVFQWGLRAPRTPVVRHERSVAPPTLPPTDHRFV